MKTKYKKSVYEKIMEKIKPKLTKAEIHELVKKIQRDEDYEESIDTLLHTMIPLVSKLESRVYSTYFFRDEFMLLGLETIQKCCDTWKEDGGQAFTTYVASRICWAIGKNRFKDPFFRRQVYYLEDIVADEEQTNCFTDKPQKVNPVYEPRYTLITNDNHEYLNTIIDSLTDNEFNILHLYYIEGLKCDRVVGERLGISKSWVQSARTNAIKKLRSKHLENEMVDLLKNAKWMPVSD